jgi:hypothetical protein
MNKYSLPTPQATLLPAHTLFHQQDGSINQLVFFDRSHSSQEPLNLPIGKALKASVTYLKDPSDFSGNTIAQQVNIYRNNGKCYSTPIYDTKYARVKVSQNRLTVTMSINLTDDPERLNARMQNFANIIIEESDEIAAMLNQEGADKVQEAWQTLASSSASQDASSVTT